MIKKILLPTIFILLAYALWLSSDFNQIAAGVAIFLFGMLSLEQGFHAFTGGTLENILRVSTDKLWKSLGFGIISTTLMQSSSLVTVITISFLSVGILDLAAGIGIIFGANLGTTTGAWLIAGFGLKVNIAAYAMPMLIFGILLVFQKNKTLKGLGAILAGMGFLFLGISYMKEGFETFRETIDLAQYALTGLKGLLIFTLIGIAATVVMQSSHATMVLIITALSVQQITYENALALAIGANVGTTITAIIGAIGATVEGKRLAGAHLLFNVITGLIALLLINQFVSLVDFIAEELNIGASDYTLKLAIFHTLFNLVGVAIMLPFIKQLVVFLERVLQGESIKVDQPKYLNNSVMAFPDTLVLAVRQETVRLYQHASHIILKTIGLSPSSVFSTQDLQQLIVQSRKITVYDVDAAYDRSVKGIYSAIIAYISQANFTWEMLQSGRLYWLREASRHIVEAIKSTKHLQKNLLETRFSTNHFVKDEYEKIRYQIADLLRQLEFFRLKAETADEEIGLLSFDVFKVKLKEQDQQMNAAIDALIREHKIKPEEGTSLINDSAYMYEIKKHLVDMAETVFVIQQQKTTESERELALDDSELIK
ncbi:MAG: Na/Pi symporter, partial [Methylococcaceae bacterium]|nr:Na/Pi symporter [Methylococcaceae bacterium]